MQGTAINISSYLLFTFYIFLLYANYVNIEIHFDSSFGVPAGLEGLSWRDISIAKVMKKNLLSGKEQSLTVPKKKKRLAYPSEVLEYGKLHWEKVTILEP